MFNPLNISRADIPCVLKNDVGETAQPMDPITLYITVDVIPHPLPLSRHQAVEAGNNKPQSREEASPASTKDLRLALDRADQAMKQIDRSNTWEGAVGRIKWMMDTLSPIAEVRIIPF